MRLDDLVTFYNGKGFNKSSLGNLPVYGSNGLIGHSDKSLFEKGIIIGRVGAYCGSVQKEYGKFWASDNTIVVKPNEKLVDFDYLFYFLTSADLNRLAGGSAQPLMTQHQLRDVECNFPLITEQRKISKFLVLLDDQLSQAKHSIDLMSDFLNELYSYWFVQYEFEREDHADGYLSSGGEFTYSEDLEKDIPKNWKVMRISELLNIDSGFPFDSNSYLESGRYKIITIKNVQSNGLNTINTNFIDEIPSRCPTSCVLNIGDVLISLTGNVGRVCLVHVVDLLLNQRVGKLNCPEIYLPFFYLYFQREEVFTRLLNLSGGSAQANLSPIEVVSDPIAIPSNETLKLFNNVAKPILSEIINLRREVEEIESFKARVTHSLVNQELVLSD